MKYKLEASIQTSGFEGDDYVEFFDLMNPDSKQEFLDECNKYNSNYYHPDIGATFYVEGNRIGWEDFVELNGELIELYIHKIAMRTVTPDKGAVS